MSTTAPGPAPAQARVEKVPGHGFPWRALLPVTVALVLLALAMWIFGGEVINATTVALVVISLMIMTRVVTWDDIVGNKAAWNTLVWFATLVALAGAPSKVGFVKWFADGVAGNMSGYSPFAAMMMLVLVFHFTHCLFASITAHVTALLPVMLAVGTTIPCLDMAQFALLLCLTLGIMGMLTPYATGPSPVYYGSGYLPARDYWILGAVFGAIFVAAFLLIGLPWMAMIRWAKDHLRKAGWAATASRPELRARLRDRAQ